MVDSIANLVLKAKAQFSHLLQVAQGSSSHPSPLKTLRKLEDEQVRFKIWAGNVGAHKTDRSSLEYRLRDASNLRLHVRKLLTELIENIDDAIKAFKDLESPPSTLDGSSQSHEDIVTELDAIMEDFPDIINCLMRLVIMIQNPVRSDRFSGAKLTDTTAYEYHDIQHVSAKFEGIDDQLAQLLGKAISSRLASSIPDYLKQLSQINQQHVYDDLRPYNCLAEDCITPGREFGKRHQWMEHMLQRHLRSAEHLETQHRKMVRGDQIDNLVMLSSQPLDEGAKVPCPLCFETMPSLQNYQRHVGKHQRQLALFALPINNYADEDTSKIGKATEENSGLDSNTDCSETEDELEPELSAAENWEQQVETPPEEQRGHQPTPSTSSSRASSPVRMNEYFVPQDGIDREVITTDVRHHLGDDASVSPGHYENPQTGQDTQGYHITSSFNLTNVMFDFSKVDPARWEAERQRRAAQSPAGMSTGRKPEYLERAHAFAAENSSPDGSLSYPKQYSGHPAPEYQTEVEQEAYSNANDYSTSALMQRLQIYIEDTDDLQDRLNTGGRGIEQQQTEDILLLQGDAVLVDHLGNGTQPDIAQAAALEPLSSNNEPGESSPAAWLHDKSGADDNSMRDFTPRYPRPFAGNGGVSREEAYEEAEHDDRHRRTTLDFLDLAQRK
ncbi:transcription factor RfeG [Colletotrichum costaricense]|uniref:Transcription factor RfeG n=1 Tax=Colletotrichum costaricense TaxID=1209916 RepID=A0AAI9Z607_9PEZI|nr:transcription factor RfeG [Colletotrichum costaricense]KAK1534477.1 transcription factor RfeG [Colletotrichum costaricense]